jgi:hypothetical protein
MRARRWTPLDGGRQVVKMIVAAVVGPSCRMLSLAFARSLGDDMKSHVVATEEIQRGPWIRSQLSYVPLAGLRSDSVFGMLPS